MRKSNKLLACLAMWLIKNFWKKRLGINYNEKHHIICRFYPTCSEYAILALDQYGLVKGLSLAIVRVRRCTTDNTESCYDCP